VARPKRRRKAYQKAAQQEVSFYAKPPVEKCRTKHTFAVIDGFDARYRFGYDQTLEKAMELAKRVARAIPKGSPSVIKVKNECTSKVILKCDADGCTRVGGLGKTKGKRA
jgi:hypothetical protein